MRNENSPIGSPGKTKSPSNFAVVPYRSFLKTRGLNKKPTYRITLKIERPRMELNLNNNPGGSKNDFDY